MTTSITKKCPMCNFDWQMIVSDEEREAFHYYQDGGQLIQEVLPDFTPAEREFCKSGYCPNCQRQIFGNGDGNHSFWHLISGSVNDYD